MLAVFDGQLSVDETCVYACVYACGDNPSYWESGLRIVSCPRLDLRGIRKPNTGKRKHAGQPQNLI